MTGDVVAIVGRNLTKRFARDKKLVITALDAVSFEARHGALTALVGPDGAGKTTLLNALATLVWAQRLHGAPDLAALGLSALRTAAVALLAIGAVWLVPARDPGIAAAVAQLVLGGLVFGAVGLGAGYALGDAALRGVLLRLVRRVRRPG